LQIKVSYPLYPTFLAAIFAFRCIYFSVHKCVRIVFIGQNTDFTCLYFTVASTCPFHTLFFIFVSGSEFFSYFVFSLSRYTLFIPGCLLNSVHIHKSWSG
jgi:hypothetical protein